MPMTTTAPRPSASLPSTTASLPSGTASLPSGTASLPIGTAAALSSAVVPELAAAQAAAAGNVDEFLRLAMIPEAQAAARFASPDLQITFTGGIRMQTPADCTAFNASRYAWVKKAVERTEVVAGTSTQEIVVYSLGTLHGAWPDGEPFEGNRYVDRFVVRDGLIVRHDVWNDSAERLLSRRDLQGA
jgi:hypothetical protein